MAKNHDRAEGGQPDLAEERQKQKKGILISFDALQRGLNIAKTEGELGVLRGKYQDLLRRAEQAFGFFEQVLESNESDPAALEVWDKLDPQKFDFEALAENARNKEGFGKISSPQKKKPEVPRPGPEASGVSGGMNDKREDDVVKTVSNPSPRNMENMESEEDAVGGLRKKAELLGATPKQLKAAGGNEHKLYKLADKLEREQKKKEDADAANTPPPAEIGLKPPQEETVLPEDMSVSAPQIEPAEETVAESPAADSGVFVGEPLAGAEGEDKQSASIKSREPNQKKNQKKAREGITLREHRVGVGGSPVKTTPPADRGEFTKNNAIVRQISKERPERRDNQKGVLDREKTLEYWKLVNAAQRSGKVVQEGDDVWNAIQALKNKYSLPPAHSESLKKLFRDNLENVLRIEQTFLSTEKPRPKKAEKISQPGPKSSVVEKKPAGPAVESPANKELDDRIRQRIYQFLDQQYMRGVSPDEMLAVFSQSKKPGFLPRNINRSDFFKATKLYERDIAAGYDPLSRLAAEIAFKFVKNYDELNASSREEADRRFVDVARREWKDFVYSSRRADEKDVDVKVVLWILQRAGVKGVKDARAVLPGTLEKGKFNIDTGGQMGVVVMKEHGEEEQDATVIVDNHPAGRQFVLRKRNPFFELYGSSAAAFMQQLLEKAGMMRYQGVTEEERARDKRSVDTMVRYSVDFDNASFPEGKLGRLTDFKRSQETIYGLGYGMTAKQLHNFFSSQSDPSKRFDEDYRRLVMMHALTRDEIKKYGLAKSQARTREVISQAEKIFERGGQRKDDRELIQEGRVVETRFGKYYVDVLLEDGDKLLGGYRAVQAYGYSGYLSYDARKQSFLLNTFEPDVNLQANYKLRQLAGRQGQILRGNMFIKSADATPLRIKLSDLLAALGAKEPQGRLREMLERENRGELLQPLPSAAEVAPDATARDLVAESASGVFAGAEPETKPEGPEMDKARAPEAAREVFSGDREILREISRNNLTKFRDWLLRSYQISEETLHETLGDRFYALISGNSDEYIRLIEQQAPQSGDEGVRSTVIQKNIPHLKQWLLQSYNISEEQLRGACGQAYRELGFDRVPMTEKPRPVQDAVAETKEEIVESEKVTIQELKQIIEEQLSKKVRVDQLELLEENGGLRLRAELDAGFLGGRIKIEGSIVSTDEDLNITIQNLEARAMVAARIRGALGELPRVIKEFFSNKFSREVRTMNIQEGNLVLTFK